MNILVGTSGDTGSAAIESVRHSGLVNIFVLYPSGGRITAVQELQMTTAAAAANATGGPGSGKLNNVHVVAVDGTSDDLDEPILRLFDREPAFGQKYQLCSINSVNVIRILMQCVHFIYMYLRMRPNAGEVVDFVLPTGAAGHLAAGVLVKRMGLPIGRLVAATNANDLMAQLLTEGRFYPRVSGALSTCSPAIDIQLPYNVERVLYLMAEGGHLQRAAEARRYMAALAPVALSLEQLAKGAQQRVRGFTLPPADLARWKRFGLAGHSVAHADVIRTIRDTWRSGQGQGQGQGQGYMLDPHTAVGVAAARLLRPQRPHTVSRAVVFATAHPAKFIPTVREATGMDEQVISTTMFERARSAPRCSCTANLARLPHRSLISCVACLCALCACASFPVPPRSVLLQSVRQCFSRHDAAHASVALYPFREGRRLGGEAAPAHRSSQRQAGRPATTTTTADQIKAVTRKTASSSTCSFLRLALVLQNDIH